MCKAMEDMRNEAAKKKAIDIALAMISAGKYALEEIATLCGLSLEEVNRLKTKKTV